MRIASEQLGPAASRIVKPSLSSARIVSQHSGVQHRQLRYVLQHHRLLVGLQHPHPVCDGILHLSALGQHSVFVRLGTAFVSSLCGSGHHLPVLGKPHWPAYSVASVFISVGDVSGVCDLWRRCALSSVFTLKGEVGCSKKVVVSPCVYGLCPGSFASSSVLCGAASALCATTISTEYDGASSSAGMAACS